MRDVRRRQPIPEPDARILPTSVDRHILESRQSNRLSKSLIVYARERVAGSFLGRPRGRMVNSKRESSDRAFIPRPASLGAAAFHAAANCGQLRLALWRMDTFHPAGFTRERPRGKDALVVGRRRGSELFVARSDDIISHPNATCRRPFAAWKIKPPEARTF